jgi:hypothetical protein
MCCHNWTWPKWDNYNQVWIMKCKRCKEIKEFKSFNDY